MSIVDTTIFFLAQVVYICAPVISIILCDTAKRYFRTGFLRMNSPMGLFLTFGLVANVVLYIIPTINTIFKLNPWNFYVYTNQYYIPYLTPITTFGWLCLLYTLSEVKTDGGPNNFRIVILPWVIMVTICHLVFITYSTTMIK